MTCCSWLCISAFLPCPRCRNRKFTRVRAYRLPHNPSNLLHGYPNTFAPDLSKHPDAASRRHGEIRYPFTLHVIRLYDDSFAIPELLADQTPVYERMWPVLNPFRNDTIICDFPATGIVANVLTVELIGKHVEQTPGSGYYACVDTLDCKGIPLSANAQRIL